MNTYITIDDTKLLGKGGFKKAYKPKEASSESSSLFETNKSMNSIVIVSIDVSTYDFNTIKSLIKEIELQNEYSFNNPQLAPKIFLVTVQFDDNEIKNMTITEFLTNNSILTNGKKIINIYLLEELCAPTPGKKKQPLIIDNNFFDKVDQLINNLISKSNLIFTDFKPQNTCPQYNASGNLTNIMGLDLDPDFTYPIDKIINVIEQETTYDIADNNKVNEIAINFSKNYMFIQFYYMLLRFANNLTPNNKVFIRNKIMELLPPEKLLEFFSIFKYICMLNIKLLELEKRQLQLKKINKTIVNITDKIQLEDLASIFPLFKYTGKESVKNTIGEIINSDLEKYIDTSTFTSNVLLPLFKNICKMFYFDSSSYNYLTSFINMDEIVNPPEKFSLEELNNIPIIYDNIPENNEEKTKTPKNNEEKTNTPMIYNNTPKNTPENTPENNEEFLSLNKTIKAPLSKKGGKRKTKKTNKLTK